MTTRGEGYRAGYEQAKTDAAKIIDEKLPHYGEGYERLLTDVRDEISGLSPTSYKYE